MDNNKNYNLGNNHKIITGSVKFDELSESIQKSLIQNNWCSPNDLPPQHQLLKSWLESNGDYDSLCEGKYLAELYIQNLSKYSSPADSYKQRTNVRKKY